MYLGGCFPMEIGCKALSRVQRPMWKYLAFSGVTGLEEVLLCMLREVQWVHLW